MRFPGLIGGFLSGCLLCWCVMAASPRSTPARGLTPVSAVSLAPADSSAAGSSRPIPTGTQSCASTACHGSLDEHQQGSELRFDEYQIWLSDPHAAAFRTLFNARSRSIFQRLRLMNADGVVLQPAKFDFQWRSCVACHQPTQADEPPALSAQGTLIAQAGEGVGCEACHGAAGEWLHLHYRPQWRSMTFAQKAATHYAPLEDISTRADACVSCHVGDAGREVNHDLIAAGHPAMKFELTWYEQRLPAHWNPQRRLEQEPALIKWLAGQLAGARQSLQQLQRRASGVSAASPNSIWPEFAEYRCFACHHDLHASSDWPEETATIPFGPWETTLLEELAKTFPSSHSEPFLKAQQQLVDAMNSSPFVAQQRVVPLVEETLRTFDDWSRGLDVSNREIAAMLQKLGASPRSSWQRDAQLFLALAAPYRYDRNGPPRRLTELRDLLTFPIRQDERFDSPKNYLSFDQPDAKSEPSSLALRCQRLIRSLANEVRAE